jgi:hypothetical protein
MSRLMDWRRFLVFTGIVGVVVGSLSSSPASATLGVISSSDAIAVYMDAPYVQGSYLANNYPAMTVTETFTTSTSGSACPSNGVVGTFTFNTGQCSIIKNNAGGSANSYVYGGALTTSDTPTTGSSAGITGNDQSDSGAIGASGTIITFDGYKNYIGLWWSAGSPGNSINFYQNDALIYTLSVDDVCARVRASANNSGCSSGVGTVTAIDSATTYTRANYYGHPFSTSTMASAEPFVFVHIFSQNSVQFDKIKLVGPGFEFDNLTVGNLSGTALTPRSSLVPVASYGATYTLTYNSQGGSSISSQTMVSGGQVSVSSSSPTKSGQIFAGWNTNESGTGTTYLSGATFPLTGTVSGNSTLYAQWASACSPITTTLDTYTVVGFKSTTPCTYTFPAGVRSATALIVGGGGGGGGDTAGGGGGGAVESRTVTPLSDPWLITVGGGGAGGAGASVGTTGTTSSLSSGATIYSAVGGSGGRPCSYNSSYCPDGAGGGGGVNSSSVSSGSGGHGGYNGAGRAGPTAGGNGISNSISGTAILYGAGGGGGQGGDCVVGSTSGGTYGGGTGYICTPATVSTAGQDWYGAGGGGGGTNGARGGNGVIYLKFVTPVPYTITATADVNGTISASGTTTVYAGDSQSYSFSPVLGYKISNVLIDGSSQGAITSYTFSNIGSNHSISVVFEKIAVIQTEAPTPPKSEAQLAAEAAAKKIADEKAAQNLAAQQKALNDISTAGKTFLDLQKELLNILNPGKVTKLPSTVNSSPSKPATNTQPNGSNSSVPDGTVLITPTQIATLDIAKTSSGNSANIAISQLKSGQRVKVTVISKTDPETKVVDLNSTEITGVTEKPSPQSGTTKSTQINIKPTPKSNGSKTSQAQISVTGAKKNQRVRVTVKSK